MYVSKADLDNFLQVGQGHAAPASVAEIHVNLSNALSMTVPDPATLLAGASLLVAIWAILEAKGASRNQDSLTQRIVLIETHRERDRLAAKNRTAVDARFEPDRLILRNAGAQTAYKVEVFLNGQPRSIHIEGDHEKPQILEILGVGAEFPYHIVRRDGMRRDFTVRVTWRDAEGVPGSWESALHIP